LRRFVVLILTVALALSITSCQAAAAPQFSDVGLRPVGKDIALLSALGIIGGYPDGTFRPDNNISRAEFAAIIAKMNNKADEAASQQAVAGKFTDVPAGLWYTGYVNVVAALGAVQGYSDGTFRPTANITQGEVITILLRCLGYNNNLPGEWPDDYARKAAELMLINNTFSAYANATRAFVASAVAGALEQGRVVYDEGTGLFSGPSEKTFMEEIFGARLVEGTVMTIDSARGTLTLAGLGAPELTIAPDAQIMGGLTVAGLAGKDIRYLVFGSEHGTIKYVEPMSKALQVKIALTGRITFNKPVKSLSIVNNGTPVDVSSFVAGSTVFIVPDLVPGQQCDLRVTATDYSGKTEVARSMFPVFEMPASLAIDDDGCVRAETSLLALQVTVNGRPVDMSQFREDDMWFAIPGLRGGEQYTIKASALTSSGEMLEAEKTIIADMDAPGIYIGNDGSVTFDRPVKDFEVTVDGVPVVDIPDDPNMCGMVLSGLVEGRPYTIHVRIVDHNGAAAEKTAAIIARGIDNRINIYSTGTVAFTSPIQSLNVTVNGTAVDTGQFKPGDLYFQIPGLKDNGSYTVKVDAVDLAGRPCSAQENITAHTEPPSVKIEASGRISANTALKGLKVTVDGIPAAVVRTGWTTYSIQGLVDGQTYKISLDATDWAHRPVSRSVTIKCDLIAPKLIGATYDPKTHTLSLQVSKMLNGNAFLSADDLIVRSGNLGSIRGYGGIDTPSMHVLKLFLADEQIEPGRTLINLKQSARPSACSPPTVHCSLSSTDRVPHHTDSPDLFGRR